MIEPGYILNERYKLLKTLGEGGMANVYLAHDLILDRDVAVKVLRLDLQNDPDTIRRFQREAMATSELVHPNIVSIYDVGEAHGQQYLVMEYVQGSDLKKYIVEHFPIPYQRVVDIMQQILSAVQVAHDHNIIHRDLKPQNILIDADGNAKITDFGIAVALSDNSMTQTNSLLGSVHYLSPEQARGAMPTRQSDIYALGIILFEMLTGTVPFEGDSAVSIALKHFQENMPAVRDFDPRVPQALENVVLKATTKDPANRYTSAMAMAADLKTALSPTRAHEAKYVVPTDGSLDETKIIPQMAAAAVTPQNPAVPKEPDVHAAPKAPGVKPAAKKGHWQRFWPFYLLGLVLVVIGGVLIFAFSGNRGDAAVPDLRGMTRSQAVSALTAADLKLGTVSHKASSKVAKDHVISSDPTRATSVKTDSAVDVVLSSGPSKVTLTDYVGRDYADVASDLRDRGFTVKKTSKTSNEVPAGQIMAQNVAAGKKVVPADTTITFTVSSGTKTFALENFAGQTKAYVTAYADSHDLTVTFEAEQFSSSVPAGAVISQSPAAGSTMVKGDRFSVTLSKGTEPVSSSSSSSSSSASTHTTTRTVTVSYVAPSGESGTDATQSGTNTVQIYLQDKTHNIASVYKNLTITSDTPVTLTFTLDANTTGAYRIVNNGKVVASEDNIE
ncbi:Stk1 family PASTA domain-containing Ser/Thr kinase [Lacticaseibacillus daqingensis]|uniref:Stk1 family PASTA domain-containing Ser/Thr kinase n=1 Tax=Lacticaseibacillus daqingensis TaxID=2486014 RepID=UPI000F78AB21|nr:Stk1 family PASTA domain-containing Ser/Thr kinase [Lacticaseibacillus daqingensis]